MKKYLISIATQSLLVNSLHVYISQVGNQNEQEKKLELKL